MAKKKSLLAAITLAKKALSKGDIVVNHLIVGVNLLAVRKLAAKENALLVLVGPADDGVVEVESGHFMYPFLWGFR